MSEQETAAWEHDPALRKTLRLASWRYQNLIGITLPDTEEEERAFDSDRARYARFVHKTHHGFPLWIDDEAAAFIAETAGVSRGIAEAWLVHYSAELDRIAPEVDWPDAGADTTEQNA